MRIVNEFTVMAATSREQMDKIFALREEVFIREQQVDRADEFDEFDETSHHFIAVDEEENAIGTARWRSTQEGIKLERFAVSRNFRSRGVGSGLVSAVLDDILIRKGPGHKMFLHAQMNAIPIYEKFGFEKVGDIFEECGILHYTMEKIS